MFSKILIANRGEIACRVMKTARRLGLDTVAVYSEADAEARHVRLADEAVFIGPPEARESYLQVERILDAARRTGAQAIHPGYGFLAENEDFAAACTRAGFVFIGPPTESIRLMGLKSAAKTLMARAGVPVVPGYHGENQDPALLQNEADRIGYPLLIKASAGGGGKGMRIVERDADFPAALASCRREADSSFGDHRVLLEKYLMRSRHIEVQVFADQRGNCIHLFERDCSVQRRHQKVLEEAPAPGLSAVRRQEMGAAAVVAARAVDYVGAGTVEFIVDQTGEFYFMEMNTRLQVEHPVTEMITGLDLVEWQIRIAAGEPLPLAQEQVAIRGHALEARIYAEDPGKNFLPSTGTVTHLAAPKESPHVRVDSGVEQGDVISPHYDPMIAKLIVWDLTRELALARMRRALARYRVSGVTCNVEFLERLVGCPAFVRGDLDTSLILREQAVLFPETEPASREACFAAALASVLHERRDSAASSGSSSPWAATDGWRLNGAFERKLIFRDAERERIVTVGYGTEGYRLALDGTAVAARGVLVGETTLRFALGGVQREGTVVIDGDRHDVFLQGRRQELRRVRPFAGAGEASAVGGALVAPMHGRIVALLVETGRGVEKETPLLVLEAMKMEMTIVAPARGEVRAFHYSVGAQVSAGAELLDFEKRE